MIAQGPPLSRSPEGWSGAMAASGGCFRSRPRVESPLMQGHHRGWKAVLLTGAVLGGVLACVAPLWPQIVGRYAESRLRRDRSLVLEAIRAQQGSGLKLGLERYLKTPEGRSALLDTFLELFSKEDPQFHRQLPRAASLCLRVGEGFVGFSYGLPSDGGGGYSRMASNRALMLQLAAARLGRFRGSELRSETYPGWVFEVSDPDREEQQSLIRLDARREAPFESTR
jgi:hypothetical protein